MDNEERSAIEHDKSLLKKMSKKGISKVIKKLPLKTKIIIAAIIAAIVFFLLLFIVLTSLITYVFYFNDDDNSNVSESDLVYIQNYSESTFWWPIGGKEITEVDGKKYARGEPTSKGITSYFLKNENRKLYDSNGNVIQSRPHYGLDIGWNNPTEYITAIAYGTVDSVNEGCSNDGYIGNYCNGGFGNYVRIKHPNNVYSVYAHLKKDSIIVKKGDIVVNGQIIGEMGKSGNSDGRHLHFQLEVGGRGSSYAVDPLDYISPEKPRPQIVENTGNENLINFIKASESSSSPPSEGDYYKVFDDGYDNLTVGYGITIQWQGDRLAKRGVDVSAIEEGSLILKSIVDDVKLEIINEKKSSITKTVAKNNLMLEEYQIDALVVRVYNVGNMSGFVEAYKKYGNTQALYDNYMSKPTLASNGEYSSGLAKRRQAEWNLFHTGVYPNKIY